MTPEQYEILQAGKSALWIQKAVGDIVGEIVDEITTQAMRLVREDKLTGEKAQLFWARIEALGNFKGRVEERIEAADKVARLTPPEM